MQIHHIDLQWTHDDELQNTSKHNIRNGIANVSKTGVNVSRFSPSQQVHFNSERPQGRRSPSKGAHAGDGDLKYDSDENQIQMTMPDPAKQSKAMSQHSQGRSPGHGGGQSSRSFDSSDRQTKKEMIRFLSRILDRNKPLFVFNTRMADDDCESGEGTPSFSMITLIHEND